MGSSPITRTNTYKSANGFIKPFAGLFIIDSKENPAGRADCESHVPDTWLPNIVKQGYLRSELNLEEHENGIDDDINDTKDIR